MKNALLQPKLNFLTNVSIDYLNENMFFFSNIVFKIKTYHDLKSNFF
jgi:hypothetical protein